MDDEEELRKRDEELRKDKIEQAKWYESLNLYYEALRIYRSIEDTENVNRIERKMEDDYSSKALELERRGRFQDAANLYFLIGNTEDVERMRRKKPDLVIHYDKESGGIAQLASEIYKTKNGTLEKEDFFRPNEPSLEDKSGSDSEKGVSTYSDKNNGDKVKEKLPVKMPRKKPMRFCPYCGETILTKKQPLFCPYCGEEL